MSISRKTEAPDPLAAFFVTEDERLSVGGLFYSPGAEGTAVHDDRELMVFWVADELYAIDIDAIQEIIKVPEVTVVPRVGAVILGIISLRGTIVPLLDLRRVLGLDVTDLTRAARILVLRSGGDPIGLVVDRVTSVVRIDGDSVEPPPVNMDPERTELLQGVGRNDDQIVIILDTGAIMKVMERFA